MVEACLSNLDHILRPNNIEPIQTGYQVIPIRGNFTPRIVLPLPENNFNIYENV